MLLKFKWRRPQNLARYFAVLDKSLKIVASGVVRRTRDKLSIKVGDGTGNLLKEYTLPYTSLEEGKRSVQYKIKSFLEETIQNA